MNKKLTIMALALCFSIVAFGHHHSGFWGGFTGGLIGGMLAPRPTYVAPAPVVVSTPVVAPAPVVTTTTTIPAYSYGYYNNVYCPTYSGYYYYGNNWIWGGPRFGHRPPPPMWRPHHGGFHHGGPHHHHHHR